jgi:hypothetical protein
MKDTIHIDMSGEFIGPRIELGMSPKLLKYLRNLVAKSGDDNTATLEILREMDRAIEAAEVLVVPRVPR